MSHEMNRVATSVRSRDPRLARNPWRLLPSLIRRPSVLASTAPIATTAPSTARPTRSPAARSVPRRDRNARSAIALNVPTALPAPIAADVSATAAVSATNAAIEHRAVNVLTPPAVRRPADRVRRKTDRIADWTADRSADRSAAVTVATGPDRTVVLMRHCDATDVAAATASAAMGSVATFVLRRAVTAA